MGEELIENYTLYYEGPDGEKHKLNGITNLENIQSGTFNYKDDQFTPHIDYNNFCVSIDMIIRMTHIRGMLDCLFGNTDTAAAGRWKRRCKRWKEKTRRNKLKGALRGV